MSLSFGDGDNEDEIMAEPIDTEPDEFRDLALEEIERYRRRDEYAPSFQNCFTVAALDALCCLMKANIIPSDPLTFVQYLQDRTCDVVRIKACESLVELGLLDKPKFLRFFFSLISTDPSPFVRDQLFKALCRGLASIAIGEKPDSNKQTPQPVKEGLDLVVEQENSIMEERQKAKARREDLHVALTALKEQTGDDEQLQEVIWQALDSPVLTVTERINLLEICSLLVDDDPALPMTFKYPEVWSAERGEKVRDKKYIVKFSKGYRTKTRGTYATQAPPPLPPPARPEPKRTITLNVNRTPSISSKPGVPPATQPQPAPAPSPAPSLPSTPAPTPAPPQLKKSISVTVSKPPAVSPVSTAKVMKQPTPNTDPVANKLPTKIATTKPITKPTTKPALKPVLKPTSSQEKVIKGGEQRRDSISVLPPIRPTIEPQQPEPKMSTPKISTNGGLSVKAPKQLKRASTESESTRPSKIIKLNTSGFIDAMKKLQPPSKIVTVKFTAWDKLASRKGSPASVTIRAAGKKPALERKSTAGSNHSTGAGNPRASPVVSTGTPKATPPPQQRPRPRSSTPTSTTRPPAHPKLDSSGGKPRKPLPDMMRKPLPSPASNNHPTPSKTSSSASHSASHSTPHPASQSVSKPTPKFKIKMKPHG
ncbi:hypothetical protein GQX73_g1398 [Xylaria multiplex]|uniref:Transcription initiation factor TFIID subunit 2 TPR repeats domain-containing protein n=1 Tax=Xylaria multiplex TaxID=323545 RepID=A0A7C8MS11_9PEZI|nr:hypothetical protein GQX73_g1398 [Xylaria multiplex]